MKGFWLAPVSRDLIFCVFAILISFFSFSSTAHATGIIRAPNNLGLVGYWSFDEGRGTQVSDLSGNGNDGVLMNGPSWTSGKVNGALELDGVNDYVTVPNSSILNVTSSLTVSVWFRLNTSSGYVDLLNKTGGSQYYLGLDSGLSNNPYFQAGNTVTEAAITIENGKWYHLVGVFDDIANTNKIYVNGDLAITETNTGTTPTNSGPITMGAWDSGLESFLDGKIDEVRIYSRALSATEVTALYNNTKGVILGNTSSQYTDGLVAHYTFDGSTITGSTVRDVVGGNDGIINGGVTPIMGKIGQGIDFGTGGGRVELGNPSSLNIDGSISISAWFKKSTCVNGGVVGKWTSGQATTSSYLLTAYSGCKMAMFISNGSTTASNGYSGAPQYPLDQWNHVVGVYDATARTIVMYLNGSVYSTGSTSIASLNIINTPVDVGSWGGSRGSSTNFQGSVDDVRIYNRALSAEEIRGLAGGGAVKVKSSTDDVLTAGLAAHLSLDSKTISGSTAQDISGNGKDGSIIGATETSGIVGEALQFNGSTDRVSVLSPLSSPDNWSYAFWVYADANPTADHAGLVGMGNNPRTAMRSTRNVNMGAEFQAGGWAGGPVSTNSFDLDKWYHVVAVWKNASSGSPTGELYVDGVLDKSQTYSAPLARPNGTHYINQRDSVRSFSGRIDDVRIYNRALSGEEVQTLYSMGR